MINTLSLLRFTIFISVALIGTAAGASDLAKEKRWAAQVEDALLDGEPVYLSDGKEKFFAIDTPAEEPGETAVIVLHGMGVHPDWPQVIYPLRTELPQAGWRTLSLQLPILHNEATDTDYDPIIKEAAPRILAGINHLKKEGSKKIIIISHSLGARMSGEALLQTDPTVIAYVGIGMGGSNSDYLGKLTIPVLDLYGTEDLEDVMKTAPARKKAGSKNAKYEQMTSKGADHFFDGEEGELVEIVSSWMTKIEAQ